jgi:hypothetical protein
MIKSTWSHPLSRDRASLTAAVGGIKVGGATALYDALGRAGGLLQGAQGPRIMVFLTDGADTGSRFSAAEIAGWARSEGIFVYGIGLGRIDADALRGLTDKTGGALQVASAAKDLSQLYRKTLAAYYRDFGEDEAKTGGAVVRSLPAGAQVSVGDHDLGPGPIKIDRLPAGEYTFKLAFGRGDWGCRAPVVAGHRTYIDAREDDLGHDLWIVSRPHGAVVFVDGAYAGITALHPVRTSGEGWPAKVKGDTRQLRLAQVPAGPHRIRLVAMPDMDYGPEQQVVVEVDMVGGERVLVVDVLGAKATLDDGRQVQMGRGQRLEEMEDEVDKLMGDEDPFDF